MLLIDLVRFRLLNRVFIVALNSMHLGLERWADDASSQCRLLAMTWGAYVDTNGIRNNSLGLQAIGGSPRLSVCVRSCKCFHGFPITGNIVGQIFTAPLAYAHVRPFAAVIGTALRRSVLTMIHMRYFSEVSGFSPIVSLN